MELDITNRIAKYILESQINVERISKDTGISISKLTYQTSYKLDCEEFLILCRYLQLSPETLFENE